MDKKLPPNFNHDRFIDELRDRGYSDEELLEVEVETVSDVLDLLDLGSIEHLLG